MTASWQATVVRKLSFYPPDSISLILTDPPYFIHKMDKDWDHQQLAAAIKPGVIKGLPAGMKFDKKQGAALYEFMHPIAAQWLTVLKPGGFCLCFSQPRLAHKMTSALEDAGFEIRDQLAWRYEGQAKAFSQDHFIRRQNLSPARRREILAALGGRKTPQLKPQMQLIVLAQKPREGTFVDNWLRYRTGLIDPHAPVLVPESFPGTVIPCPRERRRHGHLTPKPVLLCRHLIRLFSAPEAIILDPFAGAGSTAVAAGTGGATVCGL